MARKSLPTQQLLQNFTDSFILCPIPFPRRTIPPMHPGPRLLLLFPLAILIALILLLPAQSASTQSISDQSAPAPTPRTLIERASALNKDQTAKTRYTYFMLEHLEDRYDKERTIRYTGLPNLMQNIGFSKTTTLYEITWIGDLPYMRVVELQGKPLKGQALADEQARYDQAVADHSGPSWGRGWAASMPFSAAAAASWHAGKRETK